MRELIGRAVPALILAVGAVAAGYMVGGRYTFVAVTDEADLVAWRMDRFTGQVTLCVAGVSSKDEFNSACVPVLDENAPSQPWEEFGSEAGPTGSP